MLSRSLCLKRSKLRVSGKEKTHVNACYLDDVTVAQWMLLVYLFTIDQRFLVALACIYYDEKVALCPTCDGGYLHTGLAQRG